jgi:hypothetical protein
MGKGRGQRLIAETMSVTKAAVVLSVQGGMAYTEKDKVTLTFGGLSLVELCERLKPHTRIIALKLPLNYDLDSESHLVQFPDHLYMLEPPPHSFLMVAVQILREE